jgi:hypothetical protein
MTNLGKFCFLMYLRRVPVYLSLARRGTPGAGRLSRVGNCLRLCKWERVDTGVIMLSRFQK